MVSGKIRIVPIWFDLTHSDVERLAPFLADLAAIQVTGSNDTDVEDIANGIALKYSKRQRRSRLYHIFFKCLEPHFAADQDLKLFLALFDGDVEKLERALAAGADPNVTDSALWNRYHRASVKCGCFGGFRNLLLHLHEEGQIGPNKN